MLEVGPNNDPRILEAFEAAGPPSAGSEMNVAFVGERFVDLAAKISWLRSGYLALFAAGGYRFAFDPALQIVKRQIADPKRRLIYSFTIEMPELVPLSERSIVEIPEPSEEPIQAEQDATTARIKP